MQHFSIFICRPLKDCQIELAKALLKYHDFLAVNCIASHNVRRKAKLETDRVLRPFDIKLNPDLWNGLSMAVWVISCMLLSRGVQWAGGSSCPQVQPFIRWASTGRTFKGQLILYKKRVINALLTSSTLYYQLLLYIFYLLI